MPSWAAVSSTDSFLRSRSFFSTSPSFTVPPRRGSSLESLGRSRPAVYSARAGAIRDKSLPPSLGGEQLERLDRPPVRGHHLDRPPQHLLGVLAVAHLAVDLAGVVDRHAAFGIAAPGRLQLCQCPRD